jgi:septum formation protein
MAERPPLILASSSPRRAQLLRDAGMPCTIRKPSFDDTHVDFADAAPHRAAEALAYLKATSVADTLDAGIVVGSDTVLVVDGHAIGKPRDRDHAAALLDRLFDRDHHAVSAIALVDATNDRHLLAHDVATVHIARPADTELQAYLEADEWAGKAGGYNLAELEKRWPFTVTGDPTTVVGLPMRKLSAMLDAFARLPGTAS